jgi:methyltransferase (TIGR00027 family)
MQAGHSSRTALGAARHRAVHQVLERGFIFSDPFALPILGIGADAIMQDTQDDEFTRKLRLFIAIRSRLAEDALATAVAHGVRQLVILGAGLDTYAYRNPFGNTLRIFEVDYPATQVWKREKLAAASIPIPSTLTFAPVDFERQTLASGLTAAGFDADQPTFFTWLGVVPYLTEPTVYATLEFIAGLPADADVVFDYANPAESISGATSAGRRALADRVAAAGEEFKSSFDTDTLFAKLRSAGFREIEDFGPAQIVARFFPDRNITVSNRGGHILRAATGHGTESTAWRS